MQNTAAWTEIEGIIGRCGQQPVFIGFAPADLLYALSFADVLDEDTGEGYQRPRNVQHSLDFRRYITRDGSSTIPLTFNLRPDQQPDWRLTEGEGQHATLHIRRGARCLAQVDCQHRLGELGDVQTPLAFMSFVGLSLRDEMRLFVIINSKAKGLSSSLTDFHESNLAHDLILEAPHLYLARRLNDDPESPWHRLIRCGGEATSGLKRRTSLRMMQRTLGRLLVRLRELPDTNINCQYDIILGYWRAVSRVFPDEWSDPRHSLLTKGIGLYSLTLLLADLALEAPIGALTEEHFMQRLSGLKNAVDWGCHGTFAGAGGQKGAKEVYLKLKKVLDP